MVKKLDIPSKNLQITSGNYKGYYAEFKERLGDRGENITVMLNETGTYITIPIENVIFLFSDLRTRTEGIPPKEILEKESTNTSNPCHQYTKTTKIVLSDNKTLQWSERSGRKVSGSISLKIGDSVILFEDYLRNNGIEYPTENDFKQFLQITSRTDYKRKRSVEGMRKVYDKFNIPKMIDEKGVTTVINFLGKYLGNRDIDTFIQSLNVVELLNKEGYMTKKLEVQYRKTTIEGTFMEQGGELIEVVVDPESPSQQMAVFSPSVEDINFTGIEVEDHDNDDLDRDNVDMEEQAQDFAEKIHSRRYETDYKQEQDFTRDFVKPYNSPITGFLKELYEITGISVDQTHINIHSKELWEKFLVKNNVPKKDYKPFVIAYFFILLNMLNINIPVEIEQCSQTPNDDPRFLLCLVNYSNFSNVDNLGPYINFLLDEFPELSVRDHTSGLSGATKNGETGARRELINVTFDESYKKIMKQQTQNLTHLTNLSSLSKAKAKSTFNRSKYNSLLNKKQQVTAEEPVGILNLMESLSVQYPGKSNGNFGGSKGVKLQTLPYTDIIRIYDEVKNEIIFKIDLELSDPTKNNNEKTALVHLKENIDLYLHGNGLKKLSNGSKKGAEKIIKPYIEMGKRMIIERERQFHKDANKIAIEDAGKWKDQEIMRIDRNILNNIANDIIYNEQINDYVEKQWKVISKQVDSNLEVTNYKQRMTTEVDKEIQRISQREFSSYEKEIMIQDLRRYKNFLEEKFDNGQLNEVKNQQMSTLQEIKYQTMNDIEQVNNSTVIDDFTKQRLRNEIEQKYNNSINSFLKDKNNYLPFKGTFNYNLFVQEFIKKAEELTFQEIKRVDANASFSQSAKKVRIERIIKEHIDYIKVFLENPFDYDKHREYMVNKIRYQLEEEADRIKRNTNLSNGDKNNKINSLDRKFEKQIKSLDIFNTGLNAKESFDVEYYNSTQRNQKEITTLKKFYEIIKKHFDGSISIFINSDEYKGLKMYLSGSLSPSKKRYIENGPLNSFLDSESVILIESYISPLKYYTDTLEFGYINSVRQIVSYRNKMDKIHLQTLKDFLNENKKDFTRDECTQLSRMSYKTFSKLSNRKLIEGYRKFNELFMKNVNYNDIIQLRTDEQRIVSKVQENANFIKGIKSQFTTFLKDFNVKQKGDNPFDIRLSYLGTGLSSLSLNGTGNNVVKNLKDTIKQRIINSINKITSMPYAEYNMLLNKYLQLAYPQLSDKQEDNAAGSRKKRSRTSNERRELEDQLLPMVIGYELYLLFFRKQKYFTSINDFKLHIQTLISDNRNNASRKGVYERMVQYIEPIINLSENEIMILKQFTPQELQYVISVVKNPKTSYKGKSNVPVLTRHKELMGLFSKVPQIIKKVLGQSTTVTVANIDFIIQTYDCYNTYIGKQTGHQETYKRKRSPTVDAKIVIELDITNQELEEKKDTVFMKKQKK